MEHEPRIYVFGDFQFDPAESRLLRNGLPIHLPKRILETLRVLVEKNGRLVEKSELCASVWGSGFIEEGNIADTISILRKALGDDRSQNRYIETVPKRGYRFVAEVRTTEINSTPAPIVEAPAAQIAAKEELPEPEPEVFNLPPSSHPSMLVWASIGLVLLISLAITKVIARNRVSAARRDAPSLSSSPSQKDISVLKHDPETHRIYLEGRFYASRRTQEGLSRSIEYFQQAVLRDPRDAEPYSGIADSYARLADLEVEPVQGQYPLAKAAALKAVQLDGSLAEAYTSLGLVSYTYERNWSKAEEEFRRSLELDPKSSAGHVAYSNFLAAQGRFAQAMDHAQRAEELDPFSSPANTEIGRIYYLTRQYDKSIAVLRHTLDLNPYFAPAHIRLGQAYAMTQDYSNALREFQEALQLSGNDRRLEGFLGYTEARSGKTAIARQRLKKLIERSRKEYIPGYSIALIYVGLGQHDEAMDWLDIAYQEQSESLVFGMVEPLLDTERSNQRFVAILNKMGLRQIELKADLSPSMIPNPAHQH